MSFFLLALSLEIPSHAAEARERAVEFVRGRECVHHYQCVNYETLWEGGGPERKFQEWTRTRVVGDFWCEYSGRKSGDKLPIVDVEEWQRDGSIQLPDRYFYSVEMGNRTYGARYIDDAKATGSPASRVVEAVYPLDRASRPFLLELMMGDLTGVLLAEFLDRPTTKVIECGYDMYGENKAFRIIATGKPFPTQQGTEYRCTWFLDVKSGVCLHLTLDGARHDHPVRKYTLNYSPSAVAPNIPRLITSEVSHGGSTRTSLYHVRKFGTDCVMEAEEAYLDFHGFPEPVFASPRRKVWLWWVVIGVIALGAAWVLRRTRPEVHQASGELHN